MKSKFVLMVSHELSLSGTYNFTVIDIFSGILLMEWNAQLINTKITNYDYSHEKCKTFKDDVMWAGFNHSRYSLLVEIVI